MWTLTTVQSQLTRLSSVDTRAVVTSSRPLTHFDVYPLTRNELERWIRVLVATSGVRASYRGVELKLTGYSILPDGSLIQASVWHISCAFTLPLVISD